MPARVALNDPVGQGEVSPVHTMSNPGVLRIKRRIEVTDLAAHTMLYVGYILDMAN